MTLIPKMVPGLCLCLFLASPATPASMIARSDALDVFDLDIAFVNDTPFTLRLIENSLTHPKEPITVSSIRFGSTFATRTLPPGEKVRFALSLLEMGALQGTAAEGTFTFRIEETHERLTASYSFGRNSICDDALVEWLNANTRPSHPRMFVRALTQCEVRNSTPDDLWTPGVQSQQETTVIFSMAEAMTQASDSRGREEEQPRVALSAPTGPDRPSSDRSVTQNAEL